MADQMGGIKQDCGTTKSITTTRLAGEAFTLPAMRMTMGMSIITMLLADIFTT
jgi:hypothetical protein